MVLSVNPLTYVISIPKADLTLIQSTPTEIRELNLNTFRLDLKDWEDSAQGISLPKTHNHNTEVSVGGLTLARVIEILSPYTITFEDGQYAVNLVGANSNVGDRVNVNQVSVRSFNSAGMISSPEIQFNTFDGVVTIDVDYGFAGTTYPIGTPLKPVNNVNDAKIIADTRGLTMFRLLSDLTILAGESVDNLTIRSYNWNTVTVQSGASTTNTLFHKIDLYGEMSGIWNVLEDCWVNDITNFLGWMRGGSMTNVELAPYVIPDPTTLGSSYFDDLVPMYANTPTTIVMNSDVSVSITNSNEIHIIKNMVAGTVLNANLSGGKITIDSSCTGGTIIITGIGDVVNNSLLTIDDSGLLSEDTIADAVWNDLTADHITPGTAGKALSDAGSAGNPWSSLIIGNTDPNTFGEFIVGKLLKKSQFLALK